MAVLAVVGVEESARLEPGLDVPRNQRLELVVEVLGHRGGDNLAAEAGAPGGIVGEFVDALIERTHHWRCGGGMLGAHGSDLRVPIK